MTFDSVKAGFNSYIRDKYEQIGEKEKAQNLKDSDISLFMYSDEFKDYINDENFSYGKEDKETQKTDTENKNVIRIKVDKSDGSGVSAADVLNDIFKDDHVKKALDNDGDGNLSVEEMQAFIDSIGSLDGKAGSISLDDVFSGIDAIKSGTIGNGGFTPEEVASPFKGTAAEASGTVKTANVNTLGASSAYSDAAEEVISVAQKYLGLTESQAEARFGTNLLDGLWCADFVKNVLSETYGYDNLPDWYKNCSNKLSCSDVLAAAGDKAFTDISQVKPGDMIFFYTSRTTHGDARHIGFVKEVKDGKIYTIEGNSTGGKVCENSYSIDRIGQPYNGRNGIAGFARATA